MLNKNKIKEKIQSQFGNFLIISTICLIILLVLNLLIKSLIEFSWPYIIIVGIVLLISLLVRIDVSKKIILLFFITIVILSLFTIQFLFYFVIPDYYDYQPITDSRFMTIYQLQGKIQIFYSPDYPRQGDIITGYISVCSNNYSNCIDLENYTLNAFIIDKSGTDHLLIENKQFNNKTKFELEYMGEPIYIQMRYFDKEYLFILPKESFWQTFQTQFNRHPIFGLLSLIGTILGIISLRSLFNIKNLFARIKKVYREEFNKLINSLDKGWRGLVGNKQF